MRLSVGSIGKYIERDQIHKRRIHKIPMCITGNREAI